MISSVLLTSVMRDLFRPFNICNATGANSEAGTAYHHETSEFTCNF